MLYNRNMNRLESFEKMLKELVEKADYESKTMEELKKQGKEKSATYRQYYGNRLIYRFMLDKYREYGLLEGEHE